MLSCGSFVLGACTVRPAHVEGTIVYEYPTATVDLLPADPYQYPRVYFHDRYIYLIDGRWYYPTRTGWMVLREEPRELYRYRTSVRPQRRLDEPLRAPPAPPPDYPTPPPRRQP